MTKLNIKKVNGWYNIYAGKARLSKGFRTLEQAQINLERNESLYRIWSGSASVKFDNRIATGNYTTLYTDGTTVKGQLQKQK